MMRTMRTTVTLDDDLAAALRERAHRSGASFKAVINEAIRNGIEQSRKPVPYRVEARKMGAPRVDLTKATELAGRLDDDELADRMRRGR